MTKKTVYNVDAAVANHRPYVQFRGEVYPLRDMTLRDRMTFQLSLYQKQQALEEIALRDGVDKIPEEHLQPLLGEAVMQVLDGVPREVADTVTEMEFQALNEVVAKAKGLEIEVPKETRQDPM